VRQAACRYRWFLVASGALSCAAQASAITVGDGVRTPLISLFVVSHETNRWLDDGKFGAAQSTPLLGILQEPVPFPDAKPHLQVAPLLDYCVDLIRETGIPLRSIHDPANGRRVGIGASFSIRDDLPAIRLHAGTALHELFGAFSSAESFSWAVTWPIQRVTLALAGGNRRDFGDFAVVGAQWTHPAHPFAIGIGIPFKLGHGVDDLGAIFQVRMKW
jgi:hypothetical protein